MTNPLQNSYDLAPFAEIKPEHVKPAIEDLLSTSKAATEDLIASIDNANWQNFMLPLEELGNQLDKVWSPVSHINSVVNSEEMRQAYDSCLPLLSEYNTWLGQNEALYQKVQSIYDQRNALSLDETQIKILQDELRDFKLAGVTLPTEKKKRYGEIQQKLSELSSKFEQNLLDATMAWKKHFTDEKDLAGLPDSALALTRQNAANDNLEGYLLNLEFPCYFAVITYAENAELRKEIYHAYSTRASEFTPEKEGKSLNNGPLMSEMLMLKQELAQLLDFDHYADLSITAKMAQSSDEVMRFLTDLAKKSKPQAEKELDELERFAKQELKLSPLNAWDVGFASEKLKQKKYAISQEELRPYFPVDTVLSGMFQITETLFEVSIREVNQSFDKWHKDARLFEVFDKNNDSVARFYIDLYARAHKRGGAWMADYCNRFRFDDGHLQKPVAFLTCNFNPPVDGKPALLTHDEVTTLFHEFGHGLHHMLTQVEYLSASGIHGVEWDAVELPSQFMENFCYEKEGLDLISGHFETAEKLPNEMREKLQRAKNFQSAMMMVRQLEFSIFDFRIHSELMAPSEKDIQAILNDVRSQVAVITPPEWNRFQNTFSHIFAGGYSAGYYSYKWAEVLSADAFSKFEEEGIFNPETGKSFKQAILEKGGSQPAKELFKNFRGRDPEIEPLLRHSGIA